MEEIHFFVACFEGQEEKMKPEGLSSVSEWKTERCDSVF
jgi:hypothetical protein